MLFGDLYFPDERDRAIFGVDYNPPDEFRHGEWEQVCRLSKTCEDGQPVTIYECRLPARFFKVVADESPNGIGQPRMGFAFTTGSGDEIGALAYRVAKAIAEGMIGFRQGGQG